MSTLYIIYIDLMLYKILVFNHKLNIDVNNTVIITNNTTRPKLLNNSINIIISRKKEPVNRKDMLLNIKYKKYNEYIKLLLNNL